MNNTFPLVATFVAALSAFSANAFAQSISQPTSVSTTSAASNNHGHHQHQSNLVIDNPIVREMLPGAKATAGYFKLTNHSDKPVQLAGVSSTAFAKVEIHEHVMEDGMMSMQQVTKNIVINPHQSVSFSPGGYHLMLFKPKQKIRKGTQVKLEFTFDGATKVTQSAKVISVLDQQKQAENDHSHHH